jgi:hypothetical protein
MVGRRFFVLYALLVIATACSPGAPPPAADSVTDEAPATTPEAHPTRTPRPTATETPIRRPTLPPTWTPTSEPTSEFPTLTPNPNDQSINLTPAEDCSGLGPVVDPNGGRVIFGSEHEVSWTLLEDVFYYEVVLRDERGIEIDSIRRPPEVRSYTFDADLFELNKVYTWVLTPYDASAKPMCLSSVSEIRVIQ